MLLFERYYYKKLALLFSSVLLATFFIFSLIDYSTHVKIFNQSGLSFLLILGYFLSHLSLFADILLPLSLALSLIKVLTEASAKNEITALLTAAIPLRRLLKPFFLFSLFVSLLLLANFQWFYPLSRTFEEEFSANFFSEKKIIKDEVNGLLMQDGSILLYQRFDAKRNCFSELFWIKNSDSIFRIERLFLDKIPKGEKVDHFVRDAMDAITKASTLEHQSFPEMHFEKELIHMATPPSHLSLNVLSHQLRSPFGFAKTTPYLAKITSLFYSRLSTLLIPLLIALIVAPLCVTFSRVNRTFLLFSLTLVLLFTFFTLNKALLIMAENQLVAPFYAIFSPYFLIFGLLLYKKTISVFKVGL